MTLRRVCHIHPRYHSNCGRAPPLFGIQQFLCLDAAITKGPTCTKACVQTFSSEAMGTEHSDCRPHTLRRLSEKQISFVRLRHSFCFCSKSNNLYALTQHARETLLAPKGVQAPARKGQALGRSAPVHTNHRLSAAGHPRPLFVTAFIFNFVKYTTPGGRCQYFCAEFPEKIYCFIRILCENCLRELVARYQIML